MDLFSATSMNSVVRVNVPKQLRRYRIDGRLIYQIRGTRGNWPPNFNFHALSPPTVALWKLQNPHPSSAFECYQERRLLTLQSTYDRVVRQTNSAVWSAEIRKHLWLTGFVSTLPGPLCQTPQTDADLYSVCTTLLLSSVEQRLAEETCVRRHPFPHVSRV